MFVRRFSKRTPKIKPCCFFTTSIITNLLSRNFQTELLNSKNLFLVICQSLVVFLIFFPIANKTNYFPRKLFLYTRTKQTWFCTIALLWKLNCDQSNWIATFVISGNGFKWLPYKQTLNWMSVLWKNKKINLSTFSCRGGTEITEITNSSLQIKKGKNNPNPACRNIKNPPIFSLGSTYL